MIRTSFSELQHPAKMLILPIVSAIGSAALDFLLARIWPEYQGNVALAIILGSAFGLLYLFYVTATRVDQRLKSQTSFVPLAHEDLGAAGPVVASVNDILATIGHEGQKEQRDRLLLVAECVFSGVQREFADGEVRIFTESVTDDRIRRLLISAAEHAHTVYATCHSKMDEFWCEPRVGPDYLKLNTEMLDAAERHGHRPHVERVFSVEGSLQNWWENDVKKCEVIRILEKQGCDCYVVPASRFNDPKLNQEDVFLMLGEEERPFLGLEWQLDGSGAPLYIRVIHDAGKLRDRLANYRLARGLAERVDLGEIDVQSAPNNITEAYENIERMSLEYLTENSVRYLRNRSDSTQRIADYWDGLATTIVRPPASTTKLFEEQIASQWPSGDGPRRVALLGCTPETRELAHRRCRNAEVHVIDLAPHMYKAMTRLLKSSGGEFSVEREKLLRENWLCLHRLGRYDLIMGVDVVNMIPHKRRHMFIEGLYSALAPGGLLLLQTVCARDTTPRFQFVAGNPRAYVERFVTGELGQNRNHHDLFVDIAFGLEPATLEHPILSLPDAYDLVNDYYTCNERFREFAQTVRDTYHQCNSRLSLFKPDKLHPSSLENDSDCELIPPTSCQSNGLEFTKDMYVHGLRKKGRTPVGAPA